MSLKVQINKSLSTRSKETKFRLLFCSQNHPVSMICMYENIESLSVRFTSETGTRNVARIAFHINIIRVYQQVESGKLIRDGDR